jgi:hypothetical protein
MVRSHRSLGTSLRGHVLSPQGPASAKPLAIPFVSPVMALRHWFGYESLLLLTALRG